VIKHFSSLHVAVMNIAQYGCYCCALIRRVGLSNCCLSLYLHVAWDYDGVLTNAFGVLETGFPRILKSA